jgi:hypothetical protein
MDDQVIMCNSEHFTQIAELTIKEMAPRPSTINLGGNEQLIQQPHDSPH